jgi:hypothetical protein
LRGPAPWETDLPGDVFWSISIAGSIEKLAGIRLGGNSLNIISLFPTMCPLGPVSCFYN